MTKPLNGKAYGSIPHLPRSHKNTDRDKDLPQKQADWLTVKAPPGHRVTVVEKVDGSCVAVYKDFSGRLLPLIRAGHLASKSNYLQHRVFAQWVHDNSGIFRQMLDYGDRIVGEWLLQAHSTIYQLDFPPFVVFDIYRQNSGRISYRRMCDIVQYTYLTMPMKLNVGKYSLSVEEAMSALELGTRFPIVEGAPEGAVWRIEEFVPTLGGEAFQFIAKYVRPDFVAGKYLSSGEDTGQIWNKGYERWLSPKAQRMLV